MAEAEATPWNVASSKHRFPPRQQRPRKHKAWKGSKSWRPVALGPRDENRDDECRLETQYRLEGVLWFFVFEHPTLAPLLRSFLPVLEQRHISALLWLQTPPVRPSEQYLSRVRLRMLGGLAAHGCS